MLPLSNAQYKCVRDIPDFLGVHVIQDPRDVVMSGYFSHLYSHPTRGWPKLAKYRDILRSVNKDEGLILEMDFLGWVFRSMDEWNYEDSRILERRMEDIIRNAES